jgi:predicted PurR-regulated permease PerM
MSNSDSSSVDQRVLKTVMASLVQVITVLLLLYWCFTILSPFLSIIIWVLIISVALYPTHLSLSTRLGGREKLSATILI